MKISDRYLVSLKDGHTLEDHWSAIDMDLSEEGENFIYMKDINAYGVTLSDKGIIDDNVRSDDKIQVVESTYYDPPPGFHDD